MQAIETKYVGPTNARGSCIVAKAQAGRMIVGWDDSLGSDGNHAAAILAFALRWEWFGVWHMGGKADGRGNVAVCVERAVSERYVIVRDQWAILAESK